MATAPKATESAEKTAPLIRRDRGTVKSVISGDTLVVLDDKPNAQGIPGEKIITLSSINAPRLARGNEKEEAFAWEAREFLRKKVVGKKIQYSIDHTTAGGRDYVTVYLAPTGPGAAPECLNETVVSEGWGSVHKDTKKSEPLIALQEVALQAGKGVHSTTKPKPLDKLDEDSDTMYRQLKGKLVQAVVEQVRTGSSVRVTILPSRHTAQILLSGVQCPGWKKKEGDTEPQPEPQARESKYFVETHVLNRDVTLIVDGVAPNNAGADKISLTGSIEFQGHDVAEELLKAGYGKYVAYSAALRGPEWVAKLKAAEQSAKDGKRRLFASYTAPTASNGSVEEKEFVGRVSSVSNTGTIMVVPEGSTKEVQVNFSSVKVPRPALPGDEEKDAKEADKTKLISIKAERYWAAEGKETLRRRLIGQKVRVVFDYTFKPAKKPGEDKNLPEKRYYSVYHGEQNVAVILAELGLVWVMTYRSGEDRSVDYEALLMAETKAKTARKGLHSPEDKVPSRRLTDLCVDANEKDKRAAQIAKTKPFLANFERAGPMKAIVDYVFSGARFKVSVPKQSAVFIFALSGVRVPKRGDTPDSDDLSNAALLFSREKLHQQEATIEVNGLDQGGNFVGTLHLGKRNFSVLLLEAGFAELHHASADRLKEAKELQTAEDVAKNKRIGVWKNYDPEVEKQKALDAKAAAESGGFVAGGKTAEYIVTEVIDGSRVYLQQVSAESAGLEELVNQLTELSVKEVTVSPKVGEYVSAKFEDGRFYRAKVLEINGGKYKLLYVDYGNTDTVSQGNLRPLPQEASTLPDQAHRAALAYIKPLKEDNDNYADAKDALKDLALFKKFTGTIEYRDANGTYVSLVDPADGMNVTLELVREGLARLERRRKSHYSNPNYVALREAEDKAKQRRAGIWYYGDVPDSDEDEKEAPKKGAAPAAAAKKK